jgi:hypothetical protein
MTATVKAMDSQRWACRTHLFQFNGTFPEDVNIVVTAQKKYSTSVGLLAVVPLAFLFLTGQYLFVLPYPNKWRSGQRTD